MNLKDIKLDLEGVSGAEIQIPVFLISEDLKARKMFKALANLGCDECFCTDLSELVLAFAGFDDRPNGIYNFYFNLLDKHSKTFNHKEGRPVKESLKIFTALLVEKERMMQKA